MNRDLENIRVSIEQSDVLSESEKETLLNSIKAVDKELTIVEFKLERTEKVKRTTSVLLEETIDELEKKRADVEQANAALKKSLEELKSAQAQLIQSEKMASLGELTAGIAHEIQNPLNFVNNFSDVSNELVEELKAERSKLKENRDEQLEDEIIQDVGKNLQKIKHHGERASEIVKSMLQHSRSSAGEKEPTDINVLCDEYLRLAYHGMRAKDKNFNAEFKAELDPNLPKINVVPQDIGRVLLNLINNSFQAGSQKLEARSKGYLPEVTVSTKAIPLPGGARDGFREVQITVQDNGPGIPKNIRDKIFQPFFTTKPTGQGTGLGLSLSYDIVKAHGGEISLKSETSEGTMFKFTIPIL